MAEANIPVVTAPLVPWAQWLRERIYKQANGKGPEHTNGSHWFG